MADLNEKLAEIQELTIGSILDDLKGLNQPMIDEEGNPVAVPMETRQAVQRMALLALKQNGVTAPVQEGAGISQVSRLAGKLDFKGLSEKRQVVVPFPIRSDPGPSAA